MEIDHVYVSQTRRSVATVQPLADGRRVDIQVDKAFNPLDIGDHAGSRYEDTRRILGNDIFSELLTTPQPDKRYIAGGETLSEMAERAWRRILELTHDECGAQSSLVVITHEEVIGAVLCRMSDMPLSRLWWVGWTSGHTSVCEHYARYQAAWTVDT
jgi:broad specificity phosphatase PhoE